MGVSEQQAIDEAKPLVGKFFWTSILAGILSFLWTLLFIIPGIIFGVYYSLATYVVADQGISGMAAIKKSKQYLTGLWWAYFVASAKLGIVVFIIYFIPSMIVGFIAGSADPNGTGLAQVLPNLLTLFFYVFVGPYLYTYMYFLYERVKALKPEVQ